MAALPWNQWQASAGMGGSFRLESVADFVWNTQVSSRDIENQPKLGFATVELGVKFLERKNISLDDYQVVSIEEGLIGDYKNRSILIFKNESQMDEMEKDVDGYDYESQVYENAL